MKKYGILDETKILHHLTTVKRERERFRYLVKLINANRSDKLHYSNIFNKLKSYVKEGLLTCEIKKNESWFTITDLGRLQLEDNIVRIKKIERIRQGHYENPMEMFEFYLVEQIDKK